MFFSGGGGGAGPAGPGVPGPPLRSVEVQKRLHVQGCGELPLPEPGEQKEKKNRLDWAAVFFGGPGAFRPGEWFF